MGRRTTNEKNIPESQLSFEAPLSILLPMTGFVSQAPRGGAGTGRGLGLPTGGAHSAGSLFSRVSGLRVTEELVARFSPCSWSAPASCSPRAARGEMGPGWVGAVPRAGPWVCDWISVPLPVPERIPGRTHGLWTCRFFLTCDMNRPSPRRPPETLLRPWAIQKRDPTPCGRRDAADSAARKPQGPKAPP